MNKLLLVLLSTLLLGGCTTAIKSDKIISVKQRSFGLILGQNPSTQAPEIHLGFVTTVFQMIPTSTNGPINVPKYADTFSIDQGINPFNFEVRENTASGDVAIGTNATSTPVIPKAKAPELPSILPVIQNNSLENVKLRIIHE